MLSICKVIINHCMWNLVLFTIWSYAMQYFDFLFLLLIISSFSCRFSPNKILQVFVMFNQFIYFREFLFVYNEEYLIYKGQHCGGEIVVLPFQEWPAIDDGMLSRSFVDCPSYWFTWHVYWAWLYNKHRGMAIIQSDL